MSDIEKKQVSRVDIVEEDDRSSLKSSTSKIIKLGPFHLNPDDKIQRHLQNRHVQLIAIGGSIGTALSFLLEVD